MPVLLFLRISATLLPLLFSLFTSISVSSIISLVSSLMPKNFFSAWSRRPSTIYYGKTQTVSGTWEKVNYKLEYLDFSGGAKNRQAVSHVIKV
jgi:hypothetical protein